MTSPHERVALEPSLNFPLDDGETFTIIDWFTHTEDTYSTTEVLAKSSNIGAATLADRIGGEAMYEEYLDFGFGSTTEVDFPGEKILGNPPFDPQLCEEFWRAFVTSAGITLHITSIRGKNTHHIIEATFKGVARALRDAVAVTGGGLPSTKGTL